mgnify:CR=1 FL=1
MCIRDSRLTTQMKSVGEVMAFGRSFQESFQKALRGLEIGSTGLDETVNDSIIIEDEDDLKVELKFPGAERIWHLANAIRHGMKIDDVFEMSGIDPWFLHQIADLVAEETALSKMNINEMDQSHL